MTSIDRSFPGRPRLLVLAAALAVAILAAGCSPGTTPAPSSSVPPSASAPPSGAAVTTPEAAAALVLASDSRFTGLEPKNPDMIGACCFYEVTPQGDDFAVVVEIGWGDCPAGCISRHHWFYTVSADGMVAFDKEDGPALPPGVPGTGAGTGTGTGTGGGDAGVTGIQGSALAGPTCPVVTVNDPNCADRPIAGATVHVVDATGLEVARLTTDAKGMFSVALPPGQYQVRGDAVAEAMGTPASNDVVVDASGMALVVLCYDTGIR